MARTKKQTEKKDGEEAKLSARMMKVMDRKHSHEMPSGEVSCLLERIM